MWCCLIRFPRAWGQEKLAGEWLMSTSPLGFFLNRNHRIGDLHICAYLQYILALHAHIALSLHGAPTVSTVGYVDCYASPVVPSMAPGTRGIISIISLVIQYFTAFSLEISSGLLLAVPYSTYPKGRSSIVGREACWQPFSAVSRRFMFQTNEIGWPR